MVRKCSNCVHRKGQRCDLWTSEYRKIKLQFGDDLPGCYSHQTELENRFENKGW